MKIKKLQQTLLTNDKRIASGERFKKVGNLWTNESGKKQYLILKQGECFYHEVQTFQKKILLCEIPKHNPNSQNK